jgi:hypothetical protein
VRYLGGIESGSGEIHALMFIALVLVLINCSCIFGVMLFS